MTGKFRFATVLASAVALAAFAAPASAQSGVKVGNLTCNVSSGWGFIIGSGRTVLRTAWWICAAPGLAILLTVIDKFDGGPVGIESLAAALAEDRDTLEYVHEPYLIQEGFLVRTPRGRDILAACGQLSGQADSGNGFPVTEYGGEMPTAPSAHPS